MFRSLRVALVTATVLVFPLCAEAGPIRWEFSAAVGGEFGHDALNLGVHSLLVVDSSHETSGPVNFYATQYTLPTGIGQTISVNGSGQILLASLTNHGGTRLTETVPAEPTDNRFKVSVAVTDLESGQSGTLDFFGRVDLLTGGTTDDPMYLGISGEGAASLLLGRNRYVIDVHSARSETVERLVADVTVTPTATPEPGTLALTGLGLGVLGAVRRGRRPAAA